MSDVRSMGIQVPNVKCASLSSLWPIKVAFVINTGTKRERKGSRANTDVHRLCRRGCFRSLVVGPFPLCLGGEAAYKPQVPESPQHPPKKKVDPKAEGAMQT